jgi:hypothetical protein
MEKRWFLPRITLKGSQINARNGLRKKVSWRGDKRMIGNQQTKKIRITHDMKNSNNQATEKSIKITIKAIDK